MWSPNQLLENPNSFIRVASSNSCAFTAAYVPCPSDQANRSSFKWAPSSSSTCTWIFSSEPIWLSHMNLLTTVMENNGLQLELVVVISLRFMFLHPLSWFYLSSNGCKQFDFLINVFNLFSTTLATWSPLGITSGKVFTDTEPIGDGGVASTSTATILPWSLSSPHAERQ